MALPVARAAGNLARANPRLYSTQSEASFAHRNTPPMPSVEPLLSQPKTEFVTILSHRIHSVLGSAWHSITNPMSTWMPKLQKAAKAPLVQVAEAPQFVERALQVVFESERGWSWGESGAHFEGNSGGRVMLYNLAPPTPRPSLKQRLAPSPLPVPTALFNDSLYLCCAADVAINTTNPRRSHAKGDDTHSSFVYALSRPHVAMITLPNREYRGLDYGFSEQPTVAIEAVPPAPFFSSPQTQYIALAVVATGVAIATSLAAVGSFFKKPW